MTVEKVMALLINGIQGAKEEQGRDKIYEVLKDLLTKEEYEIHGDSWFREHHRTQDKSGLLKQLELQAKEKLHEPRALTLQQMIDMIYLTLNSSNLRPRILNIEEKLAEHQAEISQLHQADKATLRTLEEKMAAVEQRFSNMEAQGEKEREYADQRVGEIRHQLSKHSDMISKL